MRVAIVSDWFAPRRGGIESQLAQLAQGLARRGHDVDVVTSTPGAADRDGYRVRRLGTVVLPGVHLALSPSLPRHLRAELSRNYDVVHAHVSVVSPVGYAAAAVARSLGLPTVVTFHSVLRHKRHLLRIADVVTGLSKSPIVWTGVSELVAGQVRTALRGAEVHVLPNGIDSAFWRVRSGDAARRAPDGATLISTMRLHRKKRPRQLLAAFARAASRATAPVLLRIVGDGPERGALERDIRELGIRNARVELLGWLSPGELRTVYAAADGFVLASTRESFGIAALEAAVAGLPVIAMAEAGCREFLGAGGGILCRDDSELADAMTGFIDASKQRRPKPRAANLDRYDWSSVLADHETTYRRAMTRAAAATRAAVA